MSEPTITNQLLTINQLSAALGFDARTIRIWCKKGTFPTARRIGTQWRVLSDDVALLSMLDGHSDNTAMLAEQNQQIVQLQNQLLATQAHLAQFQTQFVELQASYDEMHSIYQAALKDADDMEKLLAASNEELNKFKEYYRRQQQQRRSGARRQAA